MLWLALYFPQLPLEVCVRGRQQGGALAVVEPLGGREQVSRCNSAAQAYGVRPGIALPAALALCADLAVQRRDRARERRALDELALWAYQFSARIDQLQQGCDAPRGDEGLCNRDRSRRLPGA